METKIGTSANNETIIIEEGNTHRHCAFANRLRRVYLSLLHAFNEERISYNIFANRWQSVNICEFMSYNSNDHISHHIALGDAVMGAIWMGHDIYKGDEIPDYMHTYVSGIVEGFRIMEEGETEWAE